MKWPPSQLSHEVTPSLPAHEVTPSPSTYEVTPSQSTHKVTPSPPTHEVTPLSTYLWSNPPVNLAMKWPSVHLPTKWHQVNLSMKWPPVHLPITWPPVHRPMKWSQSTYLWTDPPVHLPGKRPPVHLPMNWPPSPSTREVTPSPPTHEVTPVCYPRWPLTPVHLPMKWPSAYLSMELVQVRLLMDWSAVHLPMPSLRKLTSSMPLRGCFMYTVSIRYFFSGAAGASPPSVSMAASMSSTTPTWVGISAWNSARQHFFNHILITISNSCNSYNWFELFEVLGSTEDIEAFEVLGLSEDDEAFVVQDFWKCCPSPQPGTEASASFNVQACGNLHPCCKVWKLSCIKKKKKW